MSSIERQAVKPLETIKSDEKRAFYDRMIKNVSNLLSGQTDLFANAANIAALIYQSFHHNFGTDSVK